MRPSDSLGVEARERDREPSGPFVELGTQDG